MLPLVAVTSTRVAVVKFCAAVLYLYAALWGACVITRLSSFTAILFAMVCPASTFTAASQTLSPSSGLLGVAAAVPAVITWVPVESNEISVQRGFVEYATSVFAFA